MPNDRRIREVILAPTGTVVPANQYIYSLDGVEASLNDAINTGDLVFYDPKTNMTVGPGVTASQVPKLGVAVAMDTNRDGLPERLKTVFGGFIHSCSVEYASSKGANCGCNQIVDFYADCTHLDETYTIEILTRGDRELNTHYWNHWDRQVFSVNLRDFSCDSCEDGVDTKEVFCALANKINSHKIKKEGKYGHFLKKSLKTQAANRMWTAYPLFNIDKVYTISVGSNSQGCCSGCVNLSGVRGIRFVATNETVLFNGVVDANGMTPRGREDRLVALINKAFSDKKIGGSAVIDKQLTGSGAPCCDFKIRINSCQDFELLSNENTVIAPVSVTNPFQLITEESNCVGCTPGTSWTPKGGIRLVTHALELTCDCNDPVDRTYWFHREAKIVVPQTHNWIKYATKEIQPIVIPENMGVQWRKRILDSANGGPGQNYDNWTIDKTGIYMTDRKGTAFTESYRGLECHDMFCSIVIEHGLPHDNGSVAADKRVAKGRSIILVNNNNPTLFTSIKNILEPWLQSTHCSNINPLNCGNRGNETGGGGGNPEGGGGGNPQGGGGGDGQGG